MLYRSIGPLYFVWYECRPLMRGVRSTGPISAIEIKHLDARMGRPGGVLIQPPRKGALASFSFSNHRACRVGAIFEAHEEAH